MIDGFISRQLSSKLLLLTIGFVMLAEMVLFVPSAAFKRQDWLTERAQQAGLLAQALTGVPDYEASEMLTQQFMADTDVLLMAAKRDGMTELVLGEPPETSGSMIQVDLRNSQRFPSFQIHSSIPSLIHLQTNDERGPIAMMKPTAESK